MAKQITFTYGGNEYTLEYTRKSVEQMERNGFIAIDISKKPMITLPALFAGAFLAHHKSLNKELIEEIYKKMPNKDNLIDKLAEMYNEPIQALTEDPEDDAGNVTWETSW